MKFKYSYTWYGTRNSALVTNSGDGVNIMNKSKFLTRLERHLQYLYPA